MFHMKHKLISGFGRLVGWMLGILILPAIWTATAIQRRRFRKGP